MNIKILDSWLKEYLKTKASAKDIAKYLSLTSTSIERVEPYKDDFLYDIEITTNRIDLASVIGLAREAGAVLPQFGIPAEFKKPIFSKPSITDKSNTIDIQTKSDLTNRICAVVMDVTMKESPDYVKDRLESSGIRSLNNIIDITNYIMREMGHPTHVFDYDRLTTKKLLIREAKKGEHVTTLDKKTHTLLGGDIVADNGEGEIVDLLGVMGTANSVVTSETKRILFFLDNLDPHRVRKTSMSLAIRTEAAQLNEKGIDPELSMQALLRGIELYQKLADGKISSAIIDIYPNKPKEKTISITEEKINTVIGVKIPLDKSLSIMEKLGFGVQKKDTLLRVTIPSFRTDDMHDQEDVIEEVARIYGYHNLPSSLPPFFHAVPYHMAANEFYWEQRIKDSMKYWGFTEVYTYSLVSEDMFEGPITDAVELQNPLTTDMVYLRKTLIPSILEVAKENKSREQLKIFEIANIYARREKGLPDEKRIFAGLIKSPHVSFFEAKGIIEQVCANLGINTLVFKKQDRGGTGAKVYIEKEYLGEIEMLDRHIVDFELDFALLLRHAKLKKVYTPIAKYPPIIEDLATVIDHTITTADIIEMIKKADRRIASVTLLDHYKETRTFHLLYQHPEQNLTSDEAREIREKIIGILKSSYNAVIK